MWHLWSNAAAVVPYAPVSVAPVVWTEVVERARALPSITPPLSTLPQKPIAR